MEHACDKSDRILNLENQVSELNRYKDGDEAWRLRFEAKLDKILWFLLGTSISFAIGLVGAVTAYVFTKI